VAGIGEQLRFLHQPKKCFQSARYARRVFGASAPAAYSKASAWLRELRTAWVSGTNGKFFMGSSSYTDFDSREPDADSKILNGVPV
jgi:hypothetical protein